MMMLRVPKEMGATWLSIQSKYNCNMLPMMPAAMRKANVPSRQAAMDWRNCGQSAGGVLRIDLWLRLCIVD